MGIYLTEIEVNNTIYSWPDIIADSYEEADEIVLKEYKGAYEVVWKLDFVSEL